MKTWQYSCLNLKCKKTSLLNYYWTLDGGRLQGHVRRFEERTKYIGEKKRARLTSGSLSKIKHKKLSYYEKQDEEMINSLYPFSIYSPLSDGVLYHSAALHACRAHKGGEDSDNETDDFSPSVLFHGDIGAHPSPSQREGALPLTWVTAACWGFRAIFS